jgi:hypothetical protein
MIPGEGNKNVGFLELLTAFLVGLKLTGKTNMSWVWVLAPMWIPTLMFLMLVAFLMLPSN